MDGTSTFSRVMHYSECAQRSIEGAAAMPNNFSNAMPTRILRRPEASEDRRASNRLPIEREVKYKVMLGRGNVKMGAGRTINISSAGILFTTEDQLPLGERVELSVSWPAQLNNSLPLKFVAMGRLVRCEEAQAAIAIERYEFKTQGANGL